MKIIAVGDIMPGGVLSGVNKDYASNEIKQVLACADIRVGTLETAIGNTPLFYEEKLKREADVIYAKDEDLNRLKELDINIVSLANNHFTDLGKEGAEHTIELLDRYGIHHCGAGMNLESASKPVVICKDGISYAFIAFCDWRKETVGWCPIATEKDFGVNPMYDDYVCSEIKKNKEKYDYVVVMPHWGKEYRVEPTRHVYKLSVKMLEAGADIILGSHTHCIQPVLKKNGKIIVYGLGNFLFPDRFLNYPRSTFYPSTQVDISKIPTTDGYPRYVDGITYKIWKPMARYGLITQIIIQNGKNEFSSYFTHLTKDNYLELTDNSFYYSNIVKRTRFYLMSGIYPFFDFFIRLKYFLVYRFKRYKSASV